MNFIRAAKHLFTETGRVKSVLPPLVLERIRKAIAAAETRHRGEIRFVVEAALPWSYVRRDLSTRARAVMMFSKLRVWDTEENIGILLYLNLADRHIEIVADRAIARAVPQAEWDAICREFQALWRQRQYGDGVLACIEHLSDRLAQHFPPYTAARDGRAAQKTNELPDHPVVL